MGMTLFSKLSGAFKTRSQSAKKGGDSKGSHPSEAVAPLETDDALAKLSSQSKRSPAGRSKSVGTPKPVMRSGIKRVVSLPAAKHVHRPHKSVLPKKNQLVDAAPIIRPWPPAPSPVRKKPARKSKAPGAKNMTKLASVPKQAWLPLERRANRYGVVRQRTSISGADLEGQSEQKMVNWAQRTGHHRYHKTVVAGHVPPQPKTAITYEVNSEFAKDKPPTVSDFLEQVLVNRAPTWADVATEHRTALLRTLELGVQRDTCSPRVVELWLDLLSRLDELGWNENHIGNDFMEVLFALNFSKPSAASSAVAMAWVCAMEAEMWREDCGGSRNLVLENNPYFFAIQDKVNAYMDAHHSANNAVQAEQTAACDDATFEVLIGELQAMNQAATPAQAPDLNTEIDDLIAEFENMKQP